MFVAKSRKMHDQDTVYVCVVLIITRNEPWQVLIKHF
jgi:hypothetical protein